MKIFISYARVDKPFCMDFVNTLTAHDVWYDQRLYAGQDWWKEILRRLEWCDLFIYLLSKESIASPYCRKELDIARKLDREILPVLIDVTSDIPADLENVQYVDMSDSLNADNVSMLHNSIMLFERHNGNSSPQKKKVIQKLQTGEFKIPVNDSIEMVSLAAKAFEEGHYDQSVLLLKQAQAKKFKSRFINIEKMLEAAEKALAEQTRRREAEREYSQILELFRYTSTRDFACEAFVKFHEVFPDFDPDNLKQHCHLLDPLEQHRVSFLDNEILPMLKWCEIPAGIVRLSNTQSHDGQLGERSVRLSGFLMSKYPVTNQQFDIFMKAENGYCNPAWWQFSDYAMAWFEQHPEPLESRYKGDDRPRENVSWYEAIAFSRWLSHCTDYNITLPRVAQWQRAAQGDDNRFYPWGNVFQDSYCNTYESEIKSTTSVTRYDKGVSPYDVYDMAGNVWEWCLDKAEPEEGSFDYRHCVLGGSFVSPADRAQISFRYYLKPEVRYSSIGFRLVCLPNSAN